MKHLVLNDIERAMTGYTDKFTITAADFVGTTTDDLLQNVALCKLMKGDVVLDKTILRIVTAFDPVPSANAVVTLSVGRTASGYVDLLAASNLVNSTAILANVAYAAGAAIAHQPIAADDTQLYAQVDITDTDGDLATMTTGEVEILMCICRCKALRQTHA